VTFSGSLAAADKIIIHGTGEGDVAAHELLVSGNGTIRGHVRVERADIHGKVLEKIEARECLLLRRSGRIEGTAVYGEIEIEKGGVLVGRASERSAGETEGFKAPPISIGEIRSGINKFQDETKAVSFQA
jgi:cytoskeletal protein CcmA (bactofilin family)